MSTRNDRFNASLRSFDFLASGGDPSKDPRRSDSGLGVERLVDALDCDAEREAVARSAELGQRNASAVGAVLRLVWAEKVHLAKALNLIFENGSERELSLKKMKRRTYFWARNELESFFIAL